MTAFRALMLATLLAILAVLLCSCGSTKPAIGSAVEFSAGANARAESTTLAADAAAIDAAAKAARSSELERLAREQPTQLRIDAAVAARLDAATSRAVADALASTAAAAKKAAEDAQEKAAAERITTAKAEATASWLYLCRLIGLVGVAAGALLGGLLVWFTKGLMPGAPVGGIIAGTGLLVVAFGQTVTWLPVALAAVVVGGLILWAILHARAIKVGTALSHALDTVRGETMETVDDALAAVGATVKRSGMAGRLKKARTAWKTKL